MTIMEMLGQSGVLTVLGMGVVFGFLIIMVLCVSAMGKIIQAMGGNKDAAAPQAGAFPAPQAGEANNTGAVAAAITAAVTEYRAANNNSDNS